MKSFITIFTLFVFMFFMAGPGMSIAGDITNQTSSQAEGTGTGYGGGGGTGGSGGTGYGGSAEGGNAGFEINAPLIEGSKAADLKDSRGFAIPADTIFPGLVGFYGKDPEEGNQRVIPIAKLLMYTTSWDVEAAKNMIKRSGRKSIQIRDLIATKDTEPSQIVYCTIKRPSEIGATFMAQLSIGSIAAKSGKSISADVFAMAIVKASERGANYIQFMAEGYNRKVEASGWGIGANTTQAALNGGGNGSSNVSSGGTGYSKSGAGYNDYPWLQFTYLLVDDIPVW